MNKKTKRKTVAVFAPAFLVVFALVLPGITAGWDGPFIAENEVGTVGFPDPFVFQHGSYYYVFAGIQPYVFRTQNFTSEDLVRYTLTLDHGKGRQPLQVWDFSVYQHTDETFHAYLTLHYGRYKTTIAHYVPQEGEEWTDGNPITKWVKESTLLGNVNTGWVVYCGNVVRHENGTLYIIYDAGHPDEILGVDIHIKVRRLLDPATLDPDFTPRPILSPEAVYRSEDCVVGDPSFQLVEGCVIQEIQGKYALLYSTGHYDDYNYKLGAAYSDVLIPPAGQTYEKVLIPDPENLWGSDTGEEICYVLQTQIAGWPNYVAEYMNGPGIGNIVQVDSQYYMIHHARRPGVTQTGGYERYVWSIPLTIDISEQNPMETWIQPVLP